MSEITTQSHYVELQDNIARAIISMPDQAVDPSLKNIVQTWSNPAKAIEVLKALDFAIHGSLASGVVVSALRNVYKQACDYEGTTHEEVVKNAIWRHVPLLEECITIINPKSIQNVK